MQKLSETVGRRAGCSKHDASRAGGAAAFGPGGRVNRLEEKITYPKKIVDDVFRQRPLLTNAKQIQKKKKTRPAS